MDIDNNTEIIKVIECNHIFHCCCVSRYFFNMKALKKQYSFIQYSLANLQNQRIHIHMIYCMKKQKIQKFTCILSYLINSISTVTAKIKKNLYGVVKSIKDNANEVCD